MLEVASRGAALAEKLVQIQRQIDLLLLEQSVVAAEYAETGHWETEAGSNSAIDWMRFNCNLTEKAAGDRIAVGSKLPDLTMSRQAMQAGEIGFAHLTVIARTAIAVGKAFDEYSLLDMAREMSPGKLYFKSMDYRHSVDASAYTRMQAMATENRHLYLSTAEDGWLLISGALDPVGGGVVRNALERSRVSRALATTACSRIATPTRWSSWLPARPTSSCRSQALSRRCLAWLVLPGAHNEFALPISSKTVERWARDCSLTRILMQDSVVIDVGRAERAIKGPRRRALIARDQHCQWWQCERPASRCDAHHLVHWLHGGDGEIENQILLCHRHHWLVHEGGWQLIKTGDGRLMPVAPTVTFARGPD
jgi:hypothetical protein